MEQLTNLKHILHSKRANLFYLEYCRVMQKDGRVLYLSEHNKNQTKKDKQYWNIPIANTTVILLGTGTSITQAAMRMLASAGVLVGFSGGGGTPLLMASEIEWLTPHSEYRPTEYIQGWMQFWFKENSRLNVAKYFQLQRLQFIEKIWIKDQDLQAENINYTAIKANTEQAQLGIKNAPTVTKLLQIEADLTKRLYKYIAQTTGDQGFTRQREATDKANAFLNHGNYLAYGLGATTLWVLGIPHGFAVMHGKTRRGALVFDVADLIKDAIILPWAFICAKENATEQQFRQQCLQAFTNHKALDFMFTQVKQAATDESIAKGEFL